MRVWHDLHPRLTTAGRWAKLGQAPIVRGSVHSRRGRALAQTFSRGEKDPVVVVVGTRRARSRSLLARLPAPLRH